MYELRSRDESKTLVTNQPFWVKEQTDPIRVLRPQGNRSKKPQSQTKQKNKSKRTETKAPPAKPKRQHNKVDDEATRPRRRTTKAIQRNPNCRCRGTVQPEQDDVENLNKTLITPKLFVIN
jgi:hypothetical protein